MVQSIFSVCDPRVLTVCCCLISFTMVQHIQVGNWDHAKAAPRLNKVFAGKSESTRLQQKHRVADKVIATLQSKSLPAFTPIANEATVDAAWVWSPDATRASPICCGWDGNAFLDHPAECGTFKMPKSIVMDEEVVEGYRGRADFLAHSGGNGCSCPQGAQQKGWVWSDPALEPWNAARFCELLGARKLLFIGDSTMEQSASTVMNAAFQAGCQTQIQFASSDTLVQRPLGRLNRGRHWTSLVSMLKPDIVVLSAGAHVSDCHDGNSVVCGGTGGDRLFDDMFDEVVGQINRFREEDVNGTGTPRLFLWKTQQPGSCSANITNGTFNDGRYNYKSFRPRDERVVARLSAEELPFLDLRALYQRSDAHVSGAGDIHNTSPDCLHFCMPGPLDMLPGVLQTELARAAAHR